jgi:aspartate/methionine/tyrosine aminotransferase
MHWAKNWVGKLPYCLGESGVRPPSPEEFSLEGARAGRENYFGDPELRRAIARVHHTGIDQVLVSEGTSLANYTALSVLAGPDDRILVESPTYPVIEEIPRFHGAEVQRMARTPERGWQPDLEEIRRLVDAPGKHVAAVVLTRLHNPSGVELDPEFLSGLADLAEARDFVALFDEVYLDFLPEALPAHRLSSRFVTTGSLTKAYGFGGLRVGWVVGGQRWLRPMQEFSFYLQVNGSYVAQAEGIRVLENRDWILNRSRAIAARGRAGLEEWIPGRGDLDWIPPAGGITAMIRLARIRNTADFAAGLRENAGVNVAEGEYFGMPGWVRVSFGVEEPKLREALRRIGLALDEAGGGVRAA